MERRIQLRHGRHGFHRLSDARSISGQFGGGASDAFAAKLNSLGTGLVYSTYLGGTGADSGEAIAALVERAQARVECECD